MTGTFGTVDDYIASFPSEVRSVLEETRRLVRGVLPDAVEGISYQIPTYKVEGEALVYFAGWKTHVSLHPVPVLDEPLEREVAPFRSGKDTVRFPLSEPIPGGLVTRIIAAMRDARTGAEGRRAPNARSAQESTNQRIRPLISPAVKFSVWMSATRATWCLRDLSYWLRLLQMSALSAEASLRLEPRHRAVRGDPGRSGEGALSLDRTCSGGD